MAGSITEGRGQDVLIRAIARLRPSRPELRCLIAGVPHPRAKHLEYERRLDALVAELGLGDVVVRCGEVDPIDDVLLAADVIVNPVRAAEAFGRVAFEAALRGRPSVCSRIGGIPEVLEDERSALLVPPGDAGALGDAVARLLDEPEKAAAIAREAAAFARERLDPDADAERFLAIATAAAVRR
jgi:glycosyltransferase involved in cell wall biosynthesis